MTSKVLFGKAKQSDAACLLPPPEFSCHQHCDCEPSCEPQLCKPKTHARQSVIVPRDEVSRCIVLRNTGCKPKDLPAHMYCIEMKVRKKGACAVLSVERPYKATYTGAACFNWTKHFTRLPAGYYEADVFIDGKCCYTWAFHKEHCSVVADTVSNTEYSERHNCGCETPLEIEASYEPETTCGGGCA